MSRIRQLPPQIFNKIAAGEVIERPASVVKELMENSVDALATRLAVDVDAGGTERIRITDDGEGIHPEDLLLAVSSHATSKLETAEDLFRIRTFGFRGEALASLAEVSRLTLRSRTADDVEGREVRVDLGRIAAPIPCGCPVGTQIEVTDLFANVPVRRKFLKGVSTEFGHIAEQFTRIALAHPRLHLTLRHNGKLVYELPACENLLDRIGMFFGSDTAGKCIAVESEHGGVRVWGFVGHPSLSKATRKGQYLFLNGRWIQDRTLQHALGESYRGLLMVGRYPVCFLFLEMPPDLVDVNVHPTKAEVRFQDTQPLYRQLLATLRSKFLSLDLDSRLKVGAAAGGTGGVPLREPADARAEVVQRELVSWAKSQALDVPQGLAGSGRMSGGGYRGESGPGEMGRGEGRIWAPKAEGYAYLTGQAGPVAASESRTGLVAESGATAALATAAVAEMDSFFGQPSPGRGLTGTASEFDLAASTSASVAVEEMSPEETLPGAGFAVEFEAGDEGAAGTAAGTVTGATVGTSVTPAPAATTAVGSVRAMQIHDCYLVVETEEGLTVVDQHALHERILYEQFRTRVLAGTLESQKLLIPQPVELSAGDCALLVEHAEVLGTLGLGIEEFSGATVVVTRYPGLLKKADPGRIVRDVVDLLVTGGKNVSARDLTDKLLHMMACKAAVKAGQRLSPEEIDALLAQRHLVDDAHHCPHGRPTALTLSRTELDRQFGRLGA